MSKCLMSEYDRKVNKKISQIRSAVKGLRKMGYKIEIDKDVETMLGSLVDHIYVMDRTGDRVCFQKHLFTGDKTK